MGGPTSFEDGTSETAFEPRRRHRYVCALGHETSVAFHVAAEVPAQWDCVVCSATGTHEDVTAGVMADVEPSLVMKSSKTHMEQVRSRRTEEELEALLAEALRNYRKFGKAF